MSTSLQESMNAMKEMFVKRMSEFEAELPRSQGTPSLTNLNVEYNSFKCFVIEALNAFQVQIEILAQSIDSMEMRGRRKMLLVHGVSEGKNEDTAKVVIKVLQDHLKTPELTCNSIRRCHRMGRPSAEVKPRPIVVKFDNISTRDGLWLAKTKLKGTGITLSEFLTKQRHVAFMAARQKYGVTQCWTKEGFIHLISSDGSRHRVVSLKELHKIEEKEPEQSSTITKQAPRLKRAVANKK